MLSGMSAETGKTLDGLAHLKQSVRDILTTRIGTRVMRRDYGSRLPDLVDNPMNELTKLELFAETAQALAKWEPRLRLDRVYIESISPSGSIVLGLEGTSLLDGQPITLEGITL